MGDTEKAEKIKTTRFMRTHVTGVAPVEITTFALQRGITWEEALEK